MLRYEYERVGLFSWSPGGRYFLRRPSFGFNAEESST
jgi:hypothetical protein